MNTITLYTRLVRTIANHTKARYQCFIIWLSTPCFEPYAMSWPSVDLIASAALWFVTAAFCLRWRRWLYRRKVTYQLRIKRPINYRLSYMIWPMRKRLCWLISIKVRVARKTSDDLMRSKSQSALISFSTGHQLRASTTGPVIQGTSEHWFRS